MTTDDLISLAERVEAAEATAQRQIDGGFSTPSDALMALSLITRMSADVAAALRAIAGEG